MGSATSTPATSTLNVVVNDALSGEELACVSVAPADTVEHLRIAAEKKSEKELKLILGSRILYDSETLATVGIQDGVSILATVRAPGECAPIAEDGTADNIDLDEWVIPRATVRMHVRKLRVRPLIFAILLCTWLALLLLGQAATTIRWLLQFSAMDILFALAFLVIICLISCLKFHPLQVVAITIGLMMIGVPVLNIYSAVALFMPPSSTNDCSCWEVLHVPTFVALAVMYLADALPPVVKAEYGTDVGLQGLLEYAPIVLRAARASCGCAVMLYAVATFFIGSERVCTLIEQPLECSASGPLAGRGLVLGLHALGMACGEAYCVTMVTFDEDFQKFTVVAGSLLSSRLRRMQATPSTALAIPGTTQAPSHGAEVRKKIVALFDDEVRRISESKATPDNSQRLGVVRMLSLTQRTLRVLSLVDEVLPTLRAASPPRNAVAVMVTLRRAAPVLVPTTTVVIQLQKHSWCWYLLFPFFALVGVWFIYEVQYQLQTIPHSSLQRLMLLVPNLYIDPSKRALLGYSLSTVKHMSRSSRGIATFFRLPYDVFEYSLQSVYSAFVRT